MINGAIITAESVNSDGLQLSGGAMPQGTEGPQYGPRAKRVHLALSKQLHVRS